MGITETTVMKFGGTSVEDCRAIECVAGIVGAHALARPVVVVSALARVTDALLLSASEAAEGNATGAAHRLEVHFARHLSVAESLCPAARAGLAQAINRARYKITQRLEEFAAEGTATPPSKDFIASYGERLSARLLAAVLSARGLRARYVDARRCVLTDATYGEAEPLLERTYANTRARLRPMLEAGEIPVLGGFIGSTPNGDTTTLGRGGTDYTASLVGASLGAREVQIWTDVNGVLTADPRVVEAARPVPFLSYDEAAELTHFGAKVLHPKTVQPVAGYGIPVRVRNSRAPEHPGTLVQREPSIGAAHRVKAIAHRTGGVSIEIPSAGLHNGDGHRLSKVILEVVGRHGTAVDVVSTSKTGLMLTLDGGGTMLPAIVGELRRLCPLEVKERRALVCLVGDGLREASWVAAKVLSVLGDVDLSAVSQDASRDSLRLVVGEEHVGKVVRRLHRELFEGAPAVTLSEGGNAPHPPPLDEQEELFRAASGRGAIQQIDEGFLNRLPL